MAHLWKATARRNNGKLLKGMFVEILKSGTNAKPNQEELCDALNNKYKANIHSSHCGQSNFDFTEIK